MMWYKVQIVWRLKDGSKLTSNYLVKAIQESSAVSKALVLNSYPDAVESQLVERTRITVTPAPASGRKME